VVGLPLVDERIEVGDRLVVTNEHEGIDAGHSRRIASKSRVDPRRAHPALAIQAPRVRARGILLQDEQPGLEVLRDSRWRLVGRVHFNLAENRRDPNRPFALSILEKYTSASARSIFVNWCLRVLQARRLVSHSHLRLTQRRSVRLRDRSPKCDERVRPTILQRFQSAIWDDGNRTMRPSVLDTNPPPH
jgi:hypothetical protein